MMAKFKELMRKRAKEGKFMDEKEQSVKGELLDAISGIMKEKDADSLKNMKKVTVAADSEEGLKEGLKKAEEVVGEKMESEEEEDEEEEEMPACPEMSKEEKIAKLEAELAALKSE